MAQIIDKNRRGEISRFGLKNVQTEKKIRLAMAKTVYSDILRKETAKNICAVTNPRAKPICRLLE